MSSFSFDDSAGPVAGRVKTDYDPKHQNLPVTEADVTQPSSAFPHWIRCAIRRNPVREEIAEGKTSLIEVANWLLGPFPTRDAADSHAQEVRAATRHIRGEPEQAWSEVAKMTRCPNPALFPKFRDIDMTLVAAQPTKSEPIPRDHPVYPNSFAARKDIVTGADHAQPSPGASSPDGEPSGTPPGSAGKGRRKPDAGGPGGVRKRAKSGAAPVPSKRGGGKGGKGKAKQGSPRKGKPS